VTVVLFATVMTWWLNEMLAAPFKFLVLCVFKSYKNGTHFGFEVLTVVSTKMVVFWVLARSSLVELYQRFRGPCCRHHQGDDVKGLWNVGKLLPNYTALQPRRQPSWYSFSLWDGALNLILCIYKQKIIDYDRTIPNQGMIAQPNAGVSLLQNIGQASWNT
jgi:hypothetical protein